MLPEVVSVNDFDPIRDVLQFLARRKIQKVIFRREKKCWNSWKKI